MACPPPEVPCHLPEISSTKWAFLQLTRLLAWDFLCSFLTHLFANQTCVCVCVWFFPLCRPEAGSQWVEILPFKNLISFFGMTAPAPGSFSAQSLLILYWELIMRLCIFFFSFRWVKGAWLFFFFFFDRQCLCKLFFGPLNVSLLSTLVFTFHKMINNWLCQKKKGKLLPSDNECILKISLTQSSTHFFLFSHVFAFPAYSFQSKLCSCCWIACV